MFLNRYNIKSKKKKNPEVHLTVKITPPYGHYKMGFFEQGVTDLKLSTYNSLSTFFNILFIHMTLKS